MDFLRVRGARAHNLRGVDLDLPRGRLIVVTGLSGSGKSSLAFDTLYAEGQRRYVESLSTYARQFLPLMEKPDVDRIEGLSPAIAIQQRSAGANPRSTVGTVTEIHDYLRLLYARAGVAHCPDHPEAPLAAHSVAQMVDDALARAPGSLLHVLAPVAEAPAGLEPGALAQRLQDLRARGFVRFRVDGAVLDADGPGALPAAARRVEVVVDRLRVQPSLRSRIADSIETALRVGEGRIVLLEPEAARETGFALRPACPHCGYLAPALEPRLFSFNNPQGACPACAGLGQVEFFDPERVVAHPQSSLADGAIAGWDARNRRNHAVLVALAATAEPPVDLELPWERLPEDFRRRVLHGAPQPSGAPPAGDATSFAGILPLLERRWNETDSAPERELLAGLRKRHACPACGGTRLRREARFVFLVDGDGQRLAIFDIEALPLLDAAARVRTLALDGARRAIALPIVGEIGARLQFLNDVGLGYLALDRAADSLSGGEAQRIRLASQIGAGLTGVLYVLDEPSIGLHQRDNQRLIATLQRLRALGNTVLVVEHDEEMIRAADHVVDMGPGAGVHGGAVVAQGTPAQVIADPHSLTGDYLAGRRRIEVPPARVRPGAHWLRLRGATGNNLRGVDLALPVGCLVCVTGVSGSGKSTLILDTLARAVARQLHGARTDPAPHVALEGLEHFDRIVEIDQAPIGRTPRSNPATYAGLFTTVRELFAGTVAARERGYGASRFSFNVAGGRCEECEGDGLIRVAMHFLPDIYVVCESCAGRRYNRETLEIRYKGLTIAEVLDLSVEQARAFFDAVPALARRLRTLAEVGLDYLRLGQSATTLSGGEAQRIKLAQELSKRETGRTLYVLDEPTTGLHFHDIALLLRVLHRLRDAGNTVVVIEHNLDVVKTADWVVDLGPEGGAAGGSIVAAGPPEAVAGARDSQTAPFLAAALARAAAAQADGSAAAAPVPAAPKTSR
jgi:excinuclease ABC subunit A